MREASPRLILEQKEAVVVIQRPFVFAMHGKPPPGAALLLHDKAPRPSYKAAEGSSCCLWVFSLPWVLSSFRQPRRGPHDQRVWDAAQQVLARQGALYIQRHCLQVLGPLQEHTTFRESLVCYTSPPGGVDSSGSVRGSRLARHSGWRSK